MLYKLAVVGFSRMATVLVSILFTLMLTRNLNSSSAGVFFLAYTIVTVLSTVVRSGLDVVILRYFSAKGICRDTQSLLFRSILWVLILAAPCAVFLFLFSGYIGNTVFSMPGLAEVLRYFSLSIIPLALIFLMSSVYQGLGQPFWATLFQNLGILALFILIGGIYLYVYGGVGTDILASQLYVFSVSAVFIYSLFRLHYVDQVKVVKFDLWDRGNFRSAVDLGLINTVHITIAWSGLIAVGLFLDSSDVAHFAAAKRVSDLINIILMIVNMIMSPRYAKYWDAGRVEDIKREAKISTRLMIAISLPLIGFLVHYSELIMSYFGDGFEEAGCILVVIILGQFVNLATGSVGCILSMTGHESDLRNVTLISGLITLLMVVGMTAIYGVYGAAVSTAFGVALQNIMAFIYVRIRLKFYTI